MSDVRLMFLADTEEEASLIAGFGYSCGGWITAEIRPAIRSWPVPIFVLLVWKNDSLDRITSRIPPYLARLWV